MFLKKKILTISCNYGNFIHFVAAIPSLLLLSPVPAELPKVSPRGLRWQVKQNKLLVKSLIDKSEDPLEPLESSTVLVAGENEDDIGGMTASCNTSDSLGLKLSALGEENEKLKNKVKNCEATKLFLKHKLTQAEENLMRANSDFEQRSFKNFLSPNQVEVAL